MDFQHLLELLNEVFEENERQVTQYYMGDTSVVEHLIDCVMFKAMGTIESRRLVAELVMQRLKKESNDNG